MMYIINLLLIILIIALVAFGIYSLTRGGKRSAEISEVERERLAYSLKGMMDYIKNQFDEITRMNLYDLALSEDEFERRKNTKYELKKALKGAGFADSSDKKYVKTLMFDLLSNNYKVNNININYAINFDNPSRLTAQDKFEILLYQYKKEYKTNAFSQIVTEYQLDEPKFEYDPNVPSYVITEREINEIFEEQSTNFSLNFDDKLEIVVQRIYQGYKGYSVIDEIRDQNVDGVSGGVSGIPPSFLDQVGDMEEYLDETGKINIPMSYDSVWVFYKGKAMYLSFLSFGSEAELKRVCQNIYKYNNPGQLSESVGFKINEMKDGSRVVVLRPNFSESWAFFVRKFAPPTLLNTEQLLIHEGKEPVIEMLKFLIRGARVTAVTGEQGCGKTTLLMAIMKYIYPTITIRVQETAFELHLRKIYPYNNILSLRETETITGQMGLDVQKKTDGGVNILGEVATDPVAAWMIQMAQVASKFTLFTHHAKTFPNLITSLRNSLLKIGMFNDENVAEVQVVNVINFNVHLKKGVDGSRFIERITECVPKEVTYNYNDNYRNAKTMDGKWDSFMDNATEYFRHMTQTANYEHHNIVEFRDNKYYMAHPISEENIKAMRENMSPQDMREFDDFIDRVWG
ncbi:MAG: ATPase, T2SS/T4P/T4SS family [Clostridia bacterium]|nr:ATPase, T2SS/T4P/T4SS family [Clostridia bacterium]MDD4375662.1 ATPase, T2SS/T4P/T4SS family [Clostridia bacterium]